ncbi:MAG TPA: RusA family crossover junction endodeoxyribonuclease [Victivallales bacterium]|nr:RusA family crossover junction endodeoxyribonuclease [Victivallales bacterium]
MKKIIEFSIVGEPKAWKRPKHFFKNNKMWAYNPSQKDQETFLSLAIKYKPDKPIIDPVKLDLEFYFSVPKSFSKKKRELAIRGGILPAKRPDIDNLMKMVIDALQGRFFLDDSQIVSIMARKIYSEIPETKIKITILQGGR